MKLVCKRSVKQKVDGLIDEALSKGLEIYRMELNPSDFRDFVGWFKKELHYEDYKGYFQIGSYPGQNGDYVVYREVCIQTHQMYLKTKPQIELQD